jgi:nucleoside-diphosphate-sugar epimerase
MGRILVTDGATFIGSALANTLIARSKDNLLVENILHLDFLLLVAPCISIDVVNVCDTASGISSCLRKT